VVDVRRREVDGDRDGREGTGEHGVSGDRMGTDRREGPADERRHRCHTLLTTSDCTVRREVDPSTLEG
jgi:hypothetical protein